MPSDAVVDRPTFSSFLPSPRRLSIALLALAMALFASAPAHAVQPTTYVVKAGDTCREIAARYWPGDRHGLDKLHALNPQLGPPPHHLKAGTTLAIGEIAPDAHLTFLKPDVNRRTEQEADWQPAIRGDGLFRLDQINTLRGAGAEITFHDLSAVQLDENALIVIYGDAQAAKAKEKSGEVELVQGDASISLSSLRGEKPMEVKTPSAHVAVHGEAGRAANNKQQAMRVGVDKSQTSRVSVFHGGAKVAAAGKEVSVESGFGTRIEKGKQPEAPTPLPASPRWTDATPAQQLREAGTVHATLSFAKVPGAVRYRVQLAENPEFNGPALDRTLEAYPQIAELQFAVELNAPGTYWARVWAIDDKGLEGAPGERTFRLVGYRTKDLSPGANGGWKGQTQVALRLSGPEGAAVAIDGAPAATLSNGAETELRLAQPGHHTISFEGAAPLQIELAPAPVAAPPPSPPPPAPKVIEVSQTRGPLGSANAIAGGTPLPTAFVERGLYAQLRLQPEAAWPSNRAQVFLGAVDVEASNGTFALDVSGTLQSNANTGGPVLGYPSVGLRGRVLGNADFSLTLGSELNIGLGSATQGLELMRLRVWLAGGWRHDRFSLSTTQGISTASYGGNGYEANVVAGFVILPELLAQAEFDVDAAGLCPGAQCVASAGSVGVRSRWHRFELGAAIRTGLSTEGRNFWGKPGVVATLGFHLSDLGFLP